jgi:hypothetical protein
MPPLLAPPTRAGPPLLAARSLSIKGGQHGGLALDNYNVCVFVWAVPGRIFQALPTQTDKHVVFIYKIHGNFLGVVREFENKKSKSQFGLLLYICNLKPHKWSTQFFK